MTELSSPAAFMAKRHMLKTKLDLSNLIIPSFGEKAMTAIQK